MKVKEKKFYNIDKHCVKVILFGPKGLQVKIYSSSFVKSISNERKKFYNIDTHCVKVTRLAQKSSLEKIYCGSFVRGIRNEGKKVL